RPPHLEDRDRQLPARQGAAAPGCPRRVAHRGRDRGEEGAGRVGQHRDAPAGGAGREPDHALHHLPHRRGPPEPGWGLLPGARAGRLAERRDPRRPGDAGLHARGDRSRRAARSLVRHLRRGAGGARKRSSVSTLLAYARDRGALWAALAGDALLGVAVALDGGTDHHWALALRNFEIFTMPPFGVVLSVVALALLLSWAIPQAATVWRARHMVAIGIVLFCSHLMGLGLGVLNPILFAILLFFAVWLLDRLRNPQAAFHPTAFTYLVLGFCALALISTLGIPPKETLIGL